MQTNDLWEEYFENHPDEYEGIKELKSRSNKIEIEREKKRKEKLKRIEICRRLLNGEHLP